MAQIGLAKKKFKVWIWNSWQTFQVIPNAISSIAYSILIAAIILTAVLAIVIPCGALFLFGKCVDSLLKTNLAYILPKIMAVLAAIVIVPTVLVSFAALIVANIVTTLAVHLTFGIAGLIFGLVTAPILACKNPHRFWLGLKEKNLKMIKKATRDNAIAERQLFAVSQAHPDDPDLKRGFALIKASQAQLSMTKYMMKLFSPDDFLNIGVREYDDEDFLEFKDFDPNHTKCCLTGRDLFSSGSENIEVVKTSEGYALKSELDKQRKRYDNSNTVMPQLLRKFERDKTECAISLETLPVKDSSGRDKRVVRTVYGDYFDQESLQEALKHKLECPLTRRYLDMTDYTSIVAVPPPARAPMQDDSVPSQPRYTQSAPA